MNKNLRKKKALCDFENIESKIYDVINTPEWDKFIRSFKNAENIYIVGNGGNWAVATHAAVDLSRLTNSFTR